MSDAEFIKKLRCLRMHLSPLLTSDNIEVLQEAERRLNGVVSTPPEAFKKKGPQQGNRINKKEIFNMYLNK